MNQLDTDHNRRVTHNDAGKSFKPARFGPRPIPSSMFCYDHHNCRAWFDRWKMRGGNVARDAVYIQRANDLQDLRTFELKLIWAKIEERLRYRRANLRRKELASEIRAARGGPSNVVPIKR